MLAKKRIFIVLFLSVGIMLSTYGICRYAGIIKPSFKITATNHPNFDPYKFRFSDYSRYKKGKGDEENNYDGNELNIVIKKLLKPGMDEQKVDQILLNDPYVKKIDIDAANGKNYKHYIYERWYMKFIPTPNDPRIWITVEYSNSNKLIEYKYKD